MDFLYDAPAPVWELIRTAQAFEIHPVCYVEHWDGKGGRSMETCEPWQADAYTIYAWRQGQHGAMALLDVATRAQAEAVKARLQRHRGM